MTWKVPLFKMYWDEDDLQLVHDAIAAGMNWAVGPEVTRFEDQLARYTGAKYCLTFNSGTSALHAAMLAHGIGKGDEVIVPSFTFIATANAPLFVGAKPVFADIERETLGLDPADVCKRITKKTRAILPIHYGGCPCGMTELRELADEKDLILIEDAAEALGANIKSRQMGTFGDSAILSFCQNKIITTGEGGAIITGSRDIYEKLKLLRSHGRQDNGDYFSTTNVMDYISLGYNMRMSNLSAALGIAQMKKIDYIISQRRKIASTYRELLNEIPEIVVPEVPPGYSHVYQLFTIFAENRDALIRHLEGKGIMTKIYFPSVHQTHFYHTVRKDSSRLPVTEEVSATVISLPIFPGLSHKEIAYVVKEIKAFYRSSP
jgi:perosamine synthetase